MGQKRYITRIMSRFPGLRDPNILTFLYFVCLLRGNSDTSVRTHDPRTGELSELGDSEGANELQFRATRLLKASPRLYIVSDLTPWIGFGIGVWG